MKILMVNKFLHPNGGSETYIFKLGEYLTSMGHQVEYFGMEHPDRCVSNSADCYTKNIDYHSVGKIKQIGLSVKSIYSVEARRKIRQVIECFKPDIVHLNNINFQLTPSIIYEIKKHNIPIVQTVHDGQIACPSHRMFIEERHDPCRQCLNGKFTNCIKNKCLHGSLMKSAVATVESYIYHSRDTYNLVDKYICPSQFMADTITTAGVKKSKCVVMHNFCEIQSNLPPKDKSKKYALYFGRLSKEKGIETLVEVCRELPQVQFVFAGSGNLERICSNVKNIDAIGFVSGDRLRSLIRNASFSICPSECFENCSMSIIESLSFGTPVIASRMGGNPELVIDGETGIVFENKNTKELKDAILKLYNDDALLQAMSQRCIEYSTNDIKKYSQTLIEIYNSLQRCK